MPFCVVEFTSKDVNEAEQISKKLVDEGLVACVNIIPTIQSVYYWDQKLKNHSETLISAKTSFEMTDAVIARIKELHSYRVPSIIVTKIMNGNPSYLHWIKNSLTHNNNKKSERNRVL